MEWGDGIGFENFLNVESVGIMIEGWILRMGLR